MRDGRYFEKYRIWKIGGINMVVFRWALYYINKMVIEDVFNMVWNINVFLVFLEIYDKDFVFR